jgi:hypothetical protein
MAEIKEILQGITAPFEKFVNVHIPMPGLKNK